MLEIMPHQGVLSQACIEGHVARSSRRYRTTARLSVTFGLAKGREPQGLRAASFAN